MDTVYGTKKYFQSLSGASDIYRTQPCRMTNDYTYQSSLGRRSQLGAYYHMNKQPSYTNELSIANQYGGYNTWGIWRDGRNIAPSKFSEKTHTHYQKNRSFSIILTTAAFIVLLAVIAIAGLAFYFSSIKTSMENPILGFEGSFRIAKGDLFSTGLKYNHTTTYKQKIDFYKRFVERALSDNALHALRTDVWGFGDGPLIKVSFRVFLDVRKLPQNIHSVEEYIKESLFLATTASKSLYRSLRLDAESVEIKRIIDEQIVNTAAILKEAQTVPTSQTQLEKRLNKKSGTSSSGGLQTKPSSHTSTLKPRGNTRPHVTNDEPDVDVENAPVIQGSFEGSFEITKTDADISRKKAVPTRAYHSSSSGSSLTPKTVTPYSLRVKPKKQTIEKLTTIEPQQPTTTTKSTTTTTTTTSTSTTTTAPTTRRTTKTSKTTTQRTTTTPSTTTTTTPPPPSPSPTTTTTTTTTTPPPSPTTTTTTTAAPTATTTSTTTAILPTLSSFSYPSSSTKIVPKLDANLFTTIPILDTQPWRPMHREVPELLPGPPPAFPTKTLLAVGASAQPGSTSTNLPSSATATVTADPPQRRIDEFELPFVPDSPQPPALPPAFDTFATGFFQNVLRPKPATPTTEHETKPPPDVLVYHSFGSPIYDPDTENIERLGAGAHVQPHPLPVPLIDDVVIPPFKPLNPTLGTIEKLPFSIDAGDEKFEHLGGGVIVKKHSNNTAKPKPAVELNERHAATTTLSSENAKTTITTTTQKTTKLPERKPVGGEENTQLADTIGEFFMELLNLPKEENGTSVVEKNTTTTTAEVEPLESRILPEESTTTFASEAKPTTTTTTTTSTTEKPNFLNLKEIIMKRKETLNQTTTTTPKPTKSTSATPASSKRNRIRPAGKPRPASTTLDDSSLFPSHSKWQFVNSSSAAASNVEHASNMRKVFNKTLQAWVSEDVEKTENLTLNDIKNRINNATNIQDISLIFDTLASKLGITPSVPTKFPPFSQNKLKHTQKHENIKPKPTTTTTTTTITTLAPTMATPTLPPPTAATSTTTTTTTKNFIELQLQHREPFIKPMSSFMSDSVESSSEVLGAAIPVVGEAEVEIIDPTKYEEMLKSSQFAEPSTTEVAMHKLVTLLPVRSNSGIRSYNKPPAGESAAESESEARSQHGTSTSASRVNIRRKLPSRRIAAPPAEAIVKGGLKVTTTK